MGAVAVETGLMRGKAMAYLGRRQRSMRWSFGASGIPGHEVELSLCLHGSLHVLFLFGPPPWQPCMTATR